MKKCYLFVLLLALSACSDPRVDGSSDEAFQKSLTKVRGQLEGDSVNKFDESLQTFAFDRQSSSNILTVIPSLVTANLRQKLDGKTAAEIITTAEIIHKEWLQKEREQTLVEIKELEDLKLETANDENELDKFVILHSRYYKDESNKFNSLPAIDLKVKNGTSFPVSRAYFKGTLSSYNRSIPWLTENFNYEISGGLEPGEYGDWSLTLNQFGPWEKLMCQKTPS